MDPGFPKAETFLWRRILIWRAGQKTVSRIRRWTSLTARRGFLRHNNCQTTFPGLRLGRSSNASIPPEPHKRCLFKIRHTSETRDVNRETSLCQAQEGLLANGPYNLI